ncbi:substrate-binding domain-containing protein [Streptomyces sp. TRM72054]|uniref:LacI family DNA-binding transcriptional regulator n=1 Tax=Streptomyces sp. TRM72054 TaxID=2870562 RepID=UPI001C8B0B67|nr:substrate-binding domain-containing protein [Streptomyces sp. TRM72054]MBX9396561.1 substrate-binding domain-containing protein [Streptomyces sp. TRM72054]
MRELDYRPNLVARSMRTRRTGRLAVVMPPMTFSPSRMLAGAAAAAHEAGYAVEVVSLQGGAEARTERVLELADSGQVEGILALVPFRPEIEERLPTGAAVVVSADFDDSMRGIGELTDASPVAELIEHLAGLGHRRFLHVAGDQQFASARARKDAYLRAVERLGLESVGVADGDWSGESGVTAIHELDAGRLATAVIAANDVVAAGVIRGAHDRGLDVPGDLSVTGWDNNDICRYLPRGQAPEQSRNPVNTVIWRESVAPPLAMQPPPTS